MPSPFPGMDPYLEGHWSSFQLLFANAIVGQLAGMVQPRYVAFPVERFYHHTPEEPVTAVNEPSPDMFVGEAHPPLEMATVVPHLVPHVDVEILRVPDRKLVAAILILSPTNKRGIGRRQYLSRRNRILASSTHLIEIDLVLRGRRVPMLRPLPHADYFVMVNRLQKRPVSEVWPVSLRESLPRIPIPLGHREADVVLDLQKALTDSYDLVGFDLTLDYTQPPDVPLTPNDELWADRLLREAGKRP
jgi:hypothetical protein